MIYLIKYDMNQHDDVSYILNENNRFITEQYVKTVLERYEINLKTINLKDFQQAMIHISYLVRDQKFYSNNKTKPYQIHNTNIDPINNVNKATAMALQPESYERLEFLGDGIIHSILAEYLFHRYSGEDEGFMTKLRTKIENGNTLSTLARIIGLQQWIVISRYIEFNDGRQTNSKILEDAFEAFVGALHLNGGYDVCRQFIVKLIEKEIDFAMILRIETNFKERLLQYFHIRRWLDPEYGTHDISGTESRKIYKVFVRCRKHHHDEGSIVGVGEGQSKKKAEQLAAANALAHFGAYKADSSDEDEDEIEIDTSDLV